MNSTTLGNPAAFVLWLSGLSGAGKTTLARALATKLLASGIATAVLDGDEIRSGLCSDLGFGPEDRTENIRRVAEVAKILQKAGSVAIAALITPTHAHRQLARRLIGAPNFVEVFCECPLEICEARDVKGLYRRARRGEIGQFTGISSPYEAPVHPDLTLHTSSRSLSECTDEVLSLIQARWAEPIR